VRVGKRPTSIVQRSTSNVAPARCRAIGHWTFLFLLAFALRGFAETPAERLAKANAAYSSGEFAEAVYQLRELSAAGAWSHGAQHNLGNAEWKVARAGHAILAWERARSLNPSDRNTQANLRFARTKAQLVVPQSPWYEQYSEWAAPSAWLAAAALGLWGGVALLTFPRLFGTRRADWHQCTAALLLAVFLLATPALCALHTRGRVGVVLEDETPLRLTPTRDGEALVKLTAGEVARVEREREGYVYVRAEGDRAGWVERREFAKIWP
jgi:Bacterial SH3 domain